MIDHYLSLLPASLHARERLLVVVVEDDSPRPIAAKLLDRPDLLDAITEWIGEDPAFIEPWNVAEPERQLALRLGLPVNGSAPDLWPLGFKSAGRKLFSDADVPTPPGQALAAAHLLGQRGALGRVGIDFVTARSQDGPWSTYAIEINLRKPGTTHPYSVLRHLAPGNYDKDTGCYTDDTGRQKFYVATDNLIEENWTGISEADVLAALSRSGLVFDPSTRVGVVPHMLSCLAIDGRFGITAIGDSAEHAEELEEATVSAMQDLATSIG